jgi:hypothetical protein
MNSLQGAADAVQRTLGDPNLQANLKASLNQLKILLENVNKNDLVGQLSGMTHDIREILQHIDPQTVGNIISALSNLLTEAEKAGLIQNIMKALESVSSVRDLVDIAKDLALPAKLAMYGVTGALIGIALTGVVQAYLKNKKDKQLQDAIEKLIAINAQQLCVQIQQLRTSAGQYLLSIEVAQQQNPNFVLSERTAQLRVEQARIVDVISPIDINSLELLQKAQEFGEKMLRVLYQAELDNESMSDYLGRVNQNGLYWNNLIEFVSYNAVILGKKTKPILPREELNYFQIKKLYGEKKITAIMEILVKAFSENGGQKLFINLANSFEDALYHFAESIKKIPEENFEFSDDMPWSKDIKELHTYYHQNASQYIRAQWESTNWEHLSGGIQILPDRVSHIIRTRALVEFCHQASPYLCFPRNTPREMWNGTLDIPRNVSQLVLHPIDSVSNLSQALSTTTGWGKLVKGVYHHPIRFVTSQVVSLGVSAGVSSAMSALSHTTNTATQASSALSHISKTGFKLPHVPTTAATTAISSTAQNVGTGAAIGSLPVGLAQRSKQNSKNNGVEMTFAFEPSAPELYSQQLGFRCGASEAGEGVYTEYMTQADAARNKTENSSAKSISAQSYDELLKRISTVNNLTHFYDTVLNWYGEVSANTVKNKLESSSVSGVGLFSDYGSREPSQEIRRAAGMGNAEYLSTLLSKYPEHLNNIDNVNRGWTALHWAAKYNQHDCISVLLNENARYDIADKTENTSTAVDICLLNKNHQTTQLFIEHIMRKYLFDEKGNVEKALRRASHVGDLSAVKIFVFQDVNVNDVGSRSGRTALHNAAQSGHLAVVIFLIEAKANTEIMDASGKKAIDYAGNNQEIIDVLHLTSLSATTIGSSACRRGGNEM